MIFLGMVLWNILLVHMPMHYTLLRRHVFRVVVEKNSAHRWNPWRPKGQLLDLPKSFKWYRFSRTITRKPRGNAPLVMWTRTSWRTNRYESLDEIRIHGRPVICLCSARGHNFQGVTLKGFSTCCPPIENPTTQWREFTPSLFVRTAYCARLEIKDENTLLYLIDTSTYMLSW